MPRTKPFPCFSCKHCEDEIVESVDVGVGVIHRYAYICQIAPEGEEPHVAIDGEEVEEVPNWCQGFEQMEKKHDNL